MTLGETAAQAVTSGECELTQIMIILMFLILVFSARESTYRGKKTEKSRQLGNAALVGTLNGRIAAADWFNVTSDEAIVHVNIV